MQSTPFTNAFSAFFESTMKATEEYMASINDIYIRRNELSKQPIYPTFKLEHHSRPRGRPRKNTTFVIDDDEDDESTTTEPTPDFSSESEAEDSQIEDEEDSQVEEISETEKSTKPSPVISSNKTQENKSLPPPAPPVRPANAPILSAEFLEKLRSITSARIYQDYILPKQKNAVPPSQKTQTPPSSYQTVNQENKNYPLLQQKPLAPIPTIQSLNTEPEIAPVTVQELPENKTNSSIQPEIADENTNSLSMVKIQDIPSVPEPKRANTSGIIHELNNDSLSSLVAGLCADSTDDMPDSSPIEPAVVTELPVSQYLHNSVSSDEEDSQGIPISDEIPTITADELNEESESEQDDENIKIIIKTSEPTEEEALLLRIQEYATNSFPRFRRSQRIDFINYLYHDLNQMASKDLIARQIDAMFRYGLLQ